MRALFFLIVTVGCGSQVNVVPAPTDSDAIDTGDSFTDGTTETMTPPDTSTPGPDTKPPMPDTKPPPGGCGLTDPLDPPIGCTPMEGGAVPCSTTTKVASCPMDNACMATVKQSGPLLDHRIGRLRLWAPDALLSLTSIAFDPNINARCVNGGAESFNWLLQINRTAGTLKTGSAKPSADGAKFTFLNESYSGTPAATFCPGFVGPTAPLDLRPVTVSFATIGAGIETPLLPSLNIAIYDSAGIGIVLPLREARFRVASLTDTTCFGSWNKSYWCDGDSLGWTTGGSVVAKITAEEADRVPIRSASCQSLCAILVNDATKTDGKTCKRGPDGKVPEIGTHCVGGTSCKNAFLFSATFGSYGIDILP